MLACGDPDRIRVTIISLRDLKDVTEHARQNFQQLDTSFWERPVACEGGDIHHTSLDSGVEKLHADLLAVLDRELLPWAEGLKALIWESLKRASGGKENLSRIGQLMHDFHGQFPEEPSKEGLALAIRWVDNFRFIQASKK